MNRESYARASLKEGEASSLVSCFKQKKESGSLCTRQGRKLPSHSLLYLHHFSHVKQIWRIKSANSRSSDLREFAQVERFLFGRQF